MPPLSDFDAETVWAEYQSAKTQSARNRLIVHYMPTIGPIAAAIWRSRPRSIDLSDLISCGVFGLIDAIEKFEPELGWKFETYAKFRIRGAIIDELRLSDWVPRHVRDKARRVHAACSKLEGELHRTPSEVELAAEIGVTVAELRKTLSQAAYVDIVPLGEAASGSGQGIGVATGGDPVAAFEVEEMKHTLAGSVGQLPERERLILTLYYYEGLTLAEAGEMLGVTGARASQIHAQAILRLRSEFS